MSPLTSVQTAVFLHLFDEDRTKIAVAIVDERFVRTDRQTHTHTNTHTHTQTYTQVILVSVQCHELHWTDNIEAYVGIVIFFDKVWVELKRAGCCVVAFGGSETFSTMFY